MSSPSWQCIKCGTSNCKKQRSCGECGGNKTYLQALGSSKEGSQREQGKRKNANQSKLMMENKENLPGTDNTMLSITNMSGELVAKLATEAGETIGSFKQRLACIKGMPEASRQVLVADDGRVGYDEALIRCLTLGEASKTFSFVDQGYKPACKYLADPPQGGWEYDYYRVELNLLPNGSATGFYNWEYCGDMDRFDGKGTWHYNELDGELLLAWETQEWGGSYVKPTKPDPLWSKCTWDVETGQIVWYINRVGVKLHRSETPLRKGGKAVKYDSQSEDELFWRNYFGRIVMEELLWRSSQEDGFRGMLSTRSCDYQK